MFSNMSRFSGGEAPWSVSGAEANETARAMDILNSCGAVDIDEEGADRLSEAPSPRAQAQETETIPVVEEQLKVGRRTVQRGGVRVYARTVEQPVEENILLREEQRPGGAPSHGPAGHRRG